MKMVVLVGKTLLFNHWQTSILSGIIGKYIGEVIEWLMQKLAIRFPLNERGIL